MGNRRTIHATRVWEDGASRRFEVDRPTSVLLDKMMAWGYRVRF